jgi:hypothetical protein
VSTRQPQQQQQQQQPSFEQLEKQQHPCSAVETRETSLSSLQENPAAATVPLSATSDAAAAQVQQQQQHAGRSWPAVQLTCWHCESRDSSSVTGLSLSLLVQCTPALFAVQQSLTVCCYLTGAAQMSCKGHKHRLQQQQHQQQFCCLNDMKEQAGLDSSLFCASVLGVAVLRRAVVPLKLL